MSLYYTLITCTNFHSSILSQLELVHVFCLSFFSLFYDFLPLFGFSFLSFLSVSGQLPLRRIALRLGLGFELALVLGLELGSNFSRE